MRTTATQSTSKPTDLKKKVQDSNFRERLLAYLEDIIKEDLDDFTDTETHTGFSTPSSSNYSPQLATDSICAISLPHWSRCNHTKNFLIK
ncbi:unnamed protein product [Adineta ricciae]|uniref:Uncharacterized protein n=1 Tax=Adineta ricciae TaxID=249248 RepID=A0A815LZ78_ADIRI|nr:unnamed protein product [Adineta ricciae]